MKKKLPEFFIDDNLADNQSYFLSKNKAVRNEYMAIISIVNYITGIALDKTPSYTVHCNTDVFLI